MQSLELRVPPVIQLGIVAFVMWALSKAFSQLQLLIPGAVFLTAVLVILGSLIALLGVIEFRKAKTTVDPRTPDKAENLVVSGVYQFSRNPMYLGFLIILLSWAFYLENGATFLILPIFIAYMNRFQIVPEERYMFAKFGKEFSDYCSKVRRWI